MWIRRVTWFEKNERRIMLALQLAVAIALIATVLAYAPGCAVTGANLHMRTKTGLELRQCSLPILYAISDNVPTRFDENIIDAANYWNKVAGRHVLVYAGHVPYAPNDPEAGCLLVVGFPSGNHTDVSITFPDSNDVPRVEHSKMAAADMLYDPWGCIYRSSIWLKAAMLDTQPDETVTNIMIHEVGHVFGLDHNPWGGGVMHAYWPPFGKGELSDTELAAFRSLYGYGPAPEVIR